MIFMKYALALLLLVTFALPAQAQFVTKDSLYFTMDDGIQSPEEMEEEAEFVYGICNRNAYQARYFDCSCIAGAFLQERESRGPLALQNDILYQLTKSRNAKCANPAGMAGDAYKGCQLYASSMRKLEPDNEELCTCAANKAATEFGKYPRLNVQYIAKIKREALSFCKDPARRAPFLGVKSESSQSSSLNQ